MTKKRRGRGKEGRTLVVVIVVIRSGPEGQELVKGPREVIPRMGVDSLKQTKRDPSVLSPATKQTISIHPLLLSFDSTDSPS